MGSPPTCRPECVTSTDCPQNQACIKQKCKDPCPGTCGINAKCQVINHNPICTCKAGFTGDPFVTCQLERSKIIIKIKDINLVKTQFNFYKTHVEYYFHTEYYCFYQLLFLFISCLLLLFHSLSLCYNLLYFFLRTYFTGA